MHLSPFLPRPLFPFSLIFLFFFSSKRHLTLFNHCLYDQNRTSLWKVGTALFMAGLDGGGEEHNHLSGITILRSKRISFLIHLLLFSSHCFPHLQVSQTNKQAVQLKSFKKSAAPLWLGRRRRRRKGETKIGYSYLKEKINF